MAAPMAEMLAPEPELRIRLRLGGRRPRRARNALHVALCDPCIAHFGVGYGPLIGGRLGAVVRFHRRHGGQTS